MTYETRPHQTEALNATIDVCTHRYCYDFPLSVLTGTGRLTTAEGRVIGECEFEALQRKQGHGWLDGEAICSELDKHRAISYQVARCLHSQDPYFLEAEFNSSCLLFANRIRVDREFRGGSLWKRLYFTTMAKTVEKMRRLPLNYWFKVFPLDFEQPARESTDPRDLGRAIRDLEMLYSIHLGAKRLEVPAEYGRFMSAPLPPSLTKF